MGILVGIFFNRLDCRLLIVSTEQLAASVGVPTACQALDVPRSSLYWTLNVTEAWLVCEDPVPPRAIPPSERVQVRQELNSECFADQPLREVYATLIDEGTLFVFLAHDVPYSG